MKRLLASRHVRKGLIRSMIVLRNKKVFIISISLLMITGFVITSLASYFVSRNAFLTTIEKEQLPLTSDNVYSEIQRDLLRPVFISSLMASDTFLRDWMIHGEGDIRSIKKYLAEINANYNTVASFLVSEKTSNYYYSGGVLKKVSSQHERDIWYYRVRDMEPDYEINVDYDMANSDAMTIFINYKVRDYQGRFIGATGVGLEVTAVRTMIEEYEKRYNRLIYFSDKDGNIRLSGSRFPATYSSLDEMPGRKEFTSTLLARENGSYALEEDGEKVFFNVRYIPEFKWYLIVEQRGSFAVQSIRRTLIINLLICLIITAIFIGAANLTISIYQKRLEHMATTDSLTGLKNRHTFELIFNQAVREARRKNDPLSILIFDIDHFKKINDTQGHLAGDEVLVDVARLTTEAVREADSVYRWGGEEFLVVLPSCSLNNAMKVAEKIRTTIAHGKPGGLRRGITVSAGVAEFSGNESPDSLIKRADDALYQAKHAGRNRVCEG